MIMHFISPAVLVSVAKELLMKNRPTKRNKAPENERTSLIDPQKRNVIFINPTDIILACYSKPKNIYPMPQYNR